MRDGPLPAISTRDLVENPLGLAYAAFGKIEGIKLLLGCDDERARAVQAQALGRFHAVMMEAARAKRDAGITQ